MNILIISGGNSSERKISIISSEEVKKALEANKHKVKVFDIKNEAEKLSELIKDYDLVFPVLHGEEGEGGNLQKLLKKSGKPYVGGDPAGLKTGWYKIPFKKYCDENKIPSAPWKKVKTQEDVIKFGLPCVVKSTNGGSSKEVAILKNPADLKKKIFLNLFKLNQLPSGGIISTTGKTKEIVDTPNLSEKIKKQAQEIALKVHKDLDLGPYSRIDFIVSDNIPYILEVNIIPGMTPNSLFPKAAKAAGYPFPKLIQKLVDLSIYK